MEVKEAKKFLRQHRLVLVLAIIMAVISIGARIGHDIVRENVYQDCIQISAASNDSTRVESYETAISLDPSQTEAYSLILNVYSADGLFSKQESEAFLTVYNGNVRQISKRDQNYSALHSKIGFLYINGYDGPTTTRLRMALPFLRTAEEHMTQEDPNKMAVECYCRIGSYYEDYIWNAGTVAEVSPESMQALVSDIAETLPMFQNSTSSGSAYEQLGFYIAVCDLFFDQRNILASTVPQEMVQQILDSIFATLPDMKNLQQEQTKQMLETLQTNKENYFDMIDRAYSRGGA